MSEITQMIEWAFGGFWRFVGFAVLLTIVSGALRDGVTVLLAAIKPPTNR